jgi:hypothetical protein
VPGRWRLILAGDKPAPRWPAGAPFIGVHGGCSVDITGLKNRLMAVAQKRLSDAQFDDFEREVQLSFLSGGRWPQLIAALHYSQPTIAGWKPEVSDSALCTLIDDWARKNGVPLSTTLPAITALPAKPLSRAAAIVKTAATPAPAVIKKAALIAKHAAQWKTIQADFHDASENGLSEAAKTPKRGYWLEAAALEWAQQRGKLDAQPQTVSPSLVAAKIHRIKG